VPCPYCRHTERPDEHHGVSHGITRLGLSCYDDEGEWIAPADEEPVPTAAELSAVTPDPWTDPDAAAALNPPPF
jgi:hypothetical protein